MYFLIPFIQERWALPFTHESSCLFFFFFACGLQDRVRACFFFVGERKHDWPSVPILLITTGCSIRTLKVDDSR
jgi:hypothetical protein